jgi:hypothetical protein
MWNWRAYLLTALLWHPRTASQAPTARQVVEAAAEAIGGLDRLRSISAVRVEEDGDEELVTIPGDPSGPRRFTTQRVATLWRVEPLGMRRVVEQAFSMRPGRFVQTVVANDTAAMTERAGSSSAGSRFDLETAIADAALSPHRILLTALAASELRMGADTAIGGVSYHRVLFQFERGEVELFVNGVTGFPGRVRFTREYSDLVYWAMWGRVTMETVWSSWSLESNGVWFPRQRNVTFNRQPFRHYFVTQLDFAAPAPADSFAIPDSVTTRFRTNAAASTSGSSPALTPVVLADGIVLFQGGYQSTIVRTAAGVVVIEAPESDDKSRAVLAESERLFPDIPVVGVVNTSPQWMHIGGLVTYARRGIPVYALDVNGPEIAALLTAPRESAVPRTATDAQRLRLVRTSILLGSGPNRMRLIPARGIHGVAMLLVYWPEHRLLYASDMIIPPTFEPTFTTAYAAELRRTVKRLHLDVAKVYALHLPLAPWNGD